MHYEQKAFDNAPTQNLKPSYGLLYIFFELPGNKHLLPQVSSVCRNLGDYTTANDTHLPEFTCAKVRMIRAWPVTESSPPKLAALMGCADQIRRVMYKKSSMKHYTSGVFVDSVRQAVAEIGTESGWYTSGAQDRHDQGVFPAVGSHKQWQPKNSCWALVLAALRSLLVRPTAKACEHGLQMCRTHSFVIDLCVV
jgi:hypothetical protein